jgi:nicotinamidase-related amidase
MANLSASWSLDWNIVERFFQAYTLAMPSTKKKPPAKSSAAKAPRKDAAARGRQTAPLIDARQTALVLVDYQQRLMPAIHKGESVIAEACRLADVAKALGIAVVGTEQNPQGLGPNEDAIRRRCDITLQKMHFNACADGLLDLLRAPGGKPAREVVIAGCEAHVCLMQTALGLLHAKLKVWVVAQACGSRTPDNHALAMQRLAKAGAVIVSVEMAAFEWLRTCEHEQFKRVLGVLKGEGEAPR